jgi:2-polyprenyl-6-methoxyphenol hydroxylase-like FAD-dependent oxidoreductase
VTSIGIIGAGVAGLQLGLFLRQHGIQATIYTEKTPEQQFGSRLPALVGRAWHTRERERKLGVNHWDNGNNEFNRANIHVGGEQPMAFHSNLANPWIAVDMRIYFGRLLEDFAARGGDVVIGEVQASDLERISAKHDLLAVATGRGGLTELFPRIAEYSPFTSPPRLLCTGLYRGVAPAATPLSASMHFVPQHGEIFDFPIFSFESHVTGLGFEAIPGGAFEPIARMSYEDDPRRFNTAMIELMRDYAPAIYERIDPARFGLTRGLDLLQGGITPTVRRGHARLSNGKYALAIGDVRVINDPILGQGANTASRTAWMLGEAIRDSENYGEAFCRRIEQQIWAYAGPIATWSNMMLQPPPPHLIEFLVAAAQHQPIADTFINALEHPLHGAELMTSAENMAAFLKQHDWQGMPEMPMAA